MQAKPVAKFPDQPRHHGLPGVRGKRGSGPSTVPGRALAAAGSALLFVVPVGFGPLTVAAPAVALTPAATSALAAAVPASLSDDVDAAKAQLAAASQTVQDADDAVDAATAKMPAANEAVARAADAVASATAAVEVANQAVTVARAAEQQAQARVAQAKAAVAAQQVEVDKAQREMDDLRARIAMLARQTYVSGGQYTELEILLDSQDPGRFTAQLMAVKRVSQRNAELFASLTSKQAELDATMAKLKDLQNAAAEDERIAQDKAAEVADRAAEAQARAGDAQAARDTAEASKQAVADLIASTQTKRAEALTLRQQLKATYEKLQAKLLGQSGATKTWGTRRTAAEAIAWGMKWVGSGEQYDGLCLGFVDDAYDPRGSRMPAAIEQWYRAKAAGYGHGYNRNPPLGAQLFWETPGYAPGHVAMYAGGGMILTTSAFGGRVGLRTWDSMEAWLGPPVGWAEPYYG